MGSVSKRWTSCCVVAEGGWGGWGNGYRCATVCTRRLGALVDERVPWVGSRVGVGWHAGVRGARPGERGGVIDGPGVDETVKRLSGLLHVLDLLVS